MLECEKLRMELELEMERSKIPKTANHTNRARGHKKDSSIKN